MKFQSYWAVMLAFLTLGRCQAAPSPTNTTPSAATATTFAVRGYEVEGNTVLPQKLIDSVLTNYLGDSIDVPRLRQGLGALQLLYRNLGYATVSVTLPQQHLTNGMVRVKVIEGKLGRIVVIGNRYYTTNNVLRALPGLTTNILLNTRWFQPQLNEANANPDRQIYPIIAPGAEPGETDLDLRVKDQLPLHGHIELNDKATPNTPLLRLDSALQYNNLWQLDHQLGLEYDFSPKSFKSSSFMPRFFDQPAVDSYSAFYRLPLGQAAALRDTYDRLPVDFGYDQVTHQFHLPPPLGVPALTIYASRSTIEIPTRYGPLSVLTNEALLNVSQQSAERDLTFTDDLGAKASVPLRALAGFESSVSFGLDYKAYIGQTFDTNLTYFSIYGSNSFGNRILVTNKTVPLGTNHGVGVQYLPISLAWSGARPDAGGSTSFNLEEYTFLSPLESRRAIFQEIAGNKAAGGTFAKMEAGLVREERLPRNWSLLLRADGQWASEPLISNEELPLGGSSGARGYREGEAYGDTGWRGMVDLRAPPLRIGGFPYHLETIPAYARLSLFMDSGQALRLQAPGAPDITEWGAGVGVFVTAGEHFDARLTLAWALHETPLTKAGEAYFYFKVGLQF